MTWSCFGGDSQGETAMPEGLPMVVLWHSKMLESDDFVTPESFHFWRFDNKGAMPTVAPPPGVHRNVYEGPLVRYFRKALSTPHQDRKTNGEGLAAIGARIT